MANIAIRPRLAEPEPPSAEDLAIIAKPRSRRWLWLSLGALLAASALAAVLLSREESSSSYETAAVSRGDLRQRVTAVGALQPDKTLEIGSDLTGKILSVEVEENERVVAGQILARIDAEPFSSVVSQDRAQVSQASAELRRTQVELKRAEAELDRIERLTPLGAATPVELQEATLAVQSASASVDVARASLHKSAASLERAEQDLVKTEITSPIDGVVLHALVEEGQTVVSSMSATSLFEIASDLASLRAEVEIDEADIARVVPGQQATFTVSAWPDRTFQGEVVSVDIAPEDSSDVVVYGAVLRIDNRDGALRPGMTATAEIAVGEADDVLLVPARALRFRPPARDAPSGDHLWTLAGDDLTAIPVQTLGSDGTSVAVRGEGLTEGTLVVVGGGS